jgi:TonB family protein
MPSRTIAASSVVTICLFACFLFAGAAAAQVNVREVARSEASDITSWSVEARSDGNLAIDARSLFTRASCVLGVVDATEWIRLQRATLDSSVSVPVGEHVDLWQRGHMPTCNAGLARVVRSSSEAIAYVVYDRDGVTHADIPLTKGKAVAFLDAIVRALRVTAELTPPQRPHFTVMGGGPLGTDQPYFAFQVDKQVQQIHGPGDPHYPDQLRAAQVEGEVLAQFVVDADGHFVAGTFKVIKANHDLFTQAVRDALPNVRFSPAEMGGRTVPQLVQLPFLFALPKD